MRRVYGELGVEYKHVCCPAVGRYKDGLNTAPPGRGTSVITVRVKRGAILDTVNKIANLDHLRQSFANWGLKQSRGFLGTSNYMGFILYYLPRGSETSSRLGTRLHYRK